MKDKKIQEMEELLEIKNSKEVCLMELDKVKTKLMIEENKMKDIQSQNILAEMKKMTEIENISKLGNWQGSNTNTKSSDTHTKGTDIPVTDNRNGHLATKKLNLSIMSRYTPNRCHRPYL